MELREYAAVLTRRWRWWAACLVIGLALAGTVAAITPTAYTATTQVFVSSTQDGTAGSQFVQQRVRSYPDVASSAEVLEPVLDELDLDLSLTALRTQVTAVNPVDTSQINISVVDGDPQLAARIADAVAEEFSSTVSRLETTDAGTSPVALSVTNPAVVPTSPSSPQVSLLLLLGLVCGAGAGLAAAVLRDRWDRRVWSVEDARGAWGPTAPEVVAPPTRQEPADRAAQVLARRIERRAQDGPQRVVLVAPTAAGGAAVDDLVASLIRVLCARGLSAVYSAPTSHSPGSPTDGPSGQPDIEFRVVPADAALSRWRDEARDSDGVVVVCPVGSAHRVDVFELGQVLDGVEASTVAMLLTRPVRRQRRPTRGTTEHQAPAPDPAGPATADQGFFPPEGDPTTTGASSTSPKRSATDTAWAPLTPETASQRQGAASTAGEGVEPSSEREPAPASATPPAATTGKKNGSGGRRPTAPSRRQPAQSSGSRSTPSRPRLR